MTVITAQLVRLHSEVHRAVIHRLRTEAEFWLAGRGQDQFQPDDRTRSEAWRAHDIIDEVFDRGEFWGVEVDEQLVAVGAIKEADADFWTPEERAQPQVYVSRFMVAEHGRGHGRLLLQLMAERARADGIPRMRLDCWRTSTGLQSYYLSLGFRHLRTVEVGGRGSGWLAELDLTEPSSLLP